MVSVRYRGDGKRRSFRIPFAYGSPVNVAVSVAESEDKSEAPLVYGEDYKIVDGCVVYDGLAMGMLLYISLKGLAERAQALQEERVRAAEFAGLNEERAAWHAQAAASIAEDAAEQAKAVASKAYADIEAEGHARAVDAVEKIRRETGAQVELLKADCERAIQEVWAVAREAIARADNPGISAARSLEELAGYQQGFFVINPNLAKATAFSGIWPVRKKEAMAWDGFFCVIPDCPGHTNGSGWQPGETPGQPIQPGEQPGGSQKPGNPDEDGKPDWWLPCFHKHGDLWTIRVEDDNA